MLTYCRACTDLAQAMDKAAAAVGLQGADAEGGGVAHAPGNDMHEKKRELSAAGPV